MRYLPSSQKARGGVSAFRFPGAPGEAEPAVPKGARYERRSFEHGGSHLAYRLLVPSPESGTPAGIIVMLHGCTQTADDFATGTRMNMIAGSEGFVVIYPEQGRGKNSQGCWNWFRPQDQGRDGGEPAMLAALLRTVMEEFGLPEGKAFVAGLSAGGAMAAILAETHPDLFAAAGVHSGLPAGSARDIPSAFAAMRGHGPPSLPRSAVPLIVFHGTGDRTVAVANGERLVAGDAVETRHSGNGRRWTCLATHEGSEFWRVEGAGHAWFGGDPAGSFTDPAGPDASAELLRFFKGALVR